MKTLLALLAASVAVTALPATSFAGVADTAFVAFDLDADSVFDRRGRGRGADDVRPDDRGGDRNRDRSRGRDRVRVPGGSGCDDPGDVLEHPECAG